MIDLCFQQENLILEFKMHFMQQQYRKKKIIPALILIVNALLISSFVTAKAIETSSASVLTLEQAEQIALTDEPGIVSQLWQSQSLSQQAIADGQLMDPKLQLGVANLAADNFEFDQENMTQFKVGILQQFPSGNSLNIKQQKTQKQSELILSKISARKLSIIKEVRVTYLEILYWQEARKTIKKNKYFFSQLVATVQSMFSVGKNNQQDLIRAQLELNRLDDRMSKITQKINSQRSKLSRWIGSNNSNKAFTSSLPELLIPKNSQLLLVSDSSSATIDDLSQLFFTHPIIQEIDTQLQISQKEIQLVKESYKPGWGLNVSYGYRDNNPNGMKRSDFVSAGVTIDLPLFTANRQDKKLLAKEHQYQALKDKRIELLRQLVTELQQEIVNEEQLEKRHQLYNRLLLPQAKQQTQAALLAYQSDRGDFSDVMRAYIDALNAHLDERRIAVDHLQTNARILYFVSSFEQQT